MKKAMKRFLRSLLNIPKAFLRTIRDIWKTKDGKVGLIIVTFLVIIAVFAPFIAPYDPYDISQRAEKGLSPSWEHLLGTTISTGQDSFSMLIYGTRVSLTIGVITGLLIAVVGTFLGILSGYVGGIVDMILMRIVDIMIVVPSLPLTIVITNLFGKSYVVIVLVFVLFGWQSLARTVRSQVLLIKNSDYVKAAELSGASRFYIMRKHILPGILNLVIMSTALTSAGIMIAESGLSFLGLGNPTSISWGKMLADAQSGGSMLFGHWWDILAPGIGIFLSVFGFMRIGLAMEDVLAPNMKKKHRFAMLFLHMNNRYLDKVFLAMNDNSNTDINSIKDEKENKKLFNKLTKGLDLNPKPIEKKEDTNIKSTDGTVLSVKNLKVVFPTERGLLRAVEGISFDIHKGESIAIVGESGSGKSVTSHAIMGLLKNPKEMTRADVLKFDGKNLLTLSETELSKIRGKDMSLVFQNALTSLDPVIPVGKQIQEVYIRHMGLSKREAKKKTIEIMESVGISDSKRRYNEFPHRLSGGMRQRIMIAMAYCCNPKLIIADEPTTALDVTIQAQILKLLSDLQKEHGTSLLLISHDLSVVYHNSDVVYVMYAGKIVEKAKTENLFRNPYHPYTKLLLSSLDHSDKKNEVIGYLPDPVKKECHCYFYDRCPFRKNICKEKMPPLIEIEEGREVRCFEYERVKQNEQ